MAKKKTATNEAVFGSTTAVIHSILALSVVLLFAIFMYWYVKTNDNQLNLANTQYGSSSLLPAGTGNINNNQLPQDQGTNPEVPGQENPPAGSGVSPSVPSDEPLIEPVNPLGPGLMPVKPAPDGGQQQFKVPVGAYDFDSKLAKLDQANGQIELSALDSSTMDPANYGL